MLGFCSWKSNFWEVNNYALRHALACMRLLEVYKGFQKEGQRNGGLSENEFGYPYQSKEFFVKAEYPFARVDDPRIGRDFH